MQGRDDGGARAYIHVYSWFMETTGLNMSEKRSRLMHPSPVKSEAHIADAVEAWERDETELRRMDPSGTDLPDVWRMSALKCMLVGKIKEHVEMKQELRTYDTLRAEIMKCTVQERLERNRGK